MYGKDLIDSAKIAARITSALGGPAPEGFSYELFLDEQARRFPSQGQRAFNRGVARIRPG